MCGIIGYIGPKQVTTLLVEGLRRLEYRGYDSAGAVSYTHLDVYKRQGPQMMIPARPEAAVTVVSCSAVGNRRPRLMEV